MSDRFIGPVELLCKTVGSQADDLIGDAKQFVFFETPEGAGISDLRWWRRWCPALPAFADQRVIPIHEIGNRETVRRNGDQRPVAILANNRCLKAVRGHNCPGFPAGL